MGSSQPTGNSELSGQPPEREHTTALGMDLNALDRIQAAKRQKSKGYDLDDDEENTTVRRSLSHIPGRYSACVQTILANNAQDSEHFVADRAQRETWYHNHYFIPTADLCVDGRVATFAEFIGLPMGILETFCSDGSRYATFASSVYMQRAMETNRTIRKHTVNQMLIKDSKELRFVTAHYSASDNRTCCGAWDKDTSAYLRAMHKHAATLRRCLDPSIVAIVALINTDQGSLTIYGPNGMLSVEEYVNRTHDNRVLSQIVNAQLQSIFPASAPELEHLNTQESEDFFSELTEYLVHNANFVAASMIPRSGISAPVDQKTSIFIGRPIEACAGYTAFAIENGELEVMANQFHKALTRVVPNILRHTKDKKLWSIPRDREHPAQR